MKPDFNQEGLFDILEKLDEGALDELDYGVVRMDRGGIIKAYNSYESKLANHSSDSVLGQNFFTQVAPCTNNFMVAERYQAFEEDLDETIDYVLTYRIKPSPVSLRMLAKDSSDNQYLILRLKD